MAVGDYELRRVEWSPSRVAAVGLALVSAGFNFAFATTTDQRVYAILALGLLVGFVVYFTDVWVPVMYLGGAAYVAVMAAVGLLVGTPTVLVGLLDTGVQGVLFTLCCYRFVVDREPTDAGSTTP